jgi:hypothetical protein
VKLFFQSSSRIRHKSDSIQLTAGLQRDRKENGAESFHCDRIVLSICRDSWEARKIPREFRRGKSVGKFGRNAMRERCARYRRVRKSQLRNLARECGAEISRTENRETKTAAPSEEDAAETATTTRRSEIRAP